MTGLKTAGSQGGGLKTQRLISAFGKPLDAGTYFVGVVNDGEDSEAAAYTFESRAIGLDGSGAAMIVQELPFDADPSSIALTVPAGEIAYARCAVPENKKAWAIRLGSDLSGSLLAVRKGFIPDLRATNRAAADSAGGRITDGLKNEWFQLLHRQGETAVRESQDIASDYYYIAVQNAENPSEEGDLAGAATMVLESKGEIELKALGSVPGNTEIRESVEVESGEIRFFTFEVPEGITQLRVAVTNRVGGSFHFRQEELLEGYQEPFPNDYIYGFDGGSPGGTGFTNGGLVTSNPEPGIYSVNVRGELDEGTSTGTCDLLIEAIGIPILPFNGGSDTVAGQGGPGWNWYQVNVPESGFIGWDVELIDDFGGDPLVVVRKDLLPGGTSPRTTGWEGNPSANSAWPDEAVWLQDVDFTGRKQDPLSRNRGGIRFVSAFGKPLEGGLYYVGVFNRNNSEAATYSIVSRGIGLPGSDALITAETLVTGTPVTVALDSRRTRYFRTTVPAGAPSWRLRLVNINGETTLAVRRDFVPDCDCDPEGDASIEGGVRVSRDGDEWYTLLPAEGETSLVGGDYYIAVTGEGINPASKDTAGDGIARATLSVAPPVPVTDLGAVSTTPIIQNYELTGGEVGGFSLQVPAGVETLEVRMEARVNLPEMAAAPGTLLPAPGGEDDFSHGFDGGASASRRGTQILSLVAPPEGPLRLSASTGGTVPTILPASAQLQVSTVPATRLAFGPGLAGALPNSDSGSLIDSQIRVYTVDVPATLPGGLPVLGWKISVSPSIGSTVVRAYPNFAARAMAPEFEGRTAILAAPYFTTGQPWRFEVEGRGLTNYTVTSEPITLADDPWTLSTMPNEVAGDSGEGLPQGGDKGRNLGADDWDFYAVDIPEGNSGILQTVVDAINGVPNLYLREGDVPAIGHNATGLLPRNGQGLFDRALETEDSLTLYGNWVPLDGRTETQLKPGRYYLGVFAAENSNARYRLRVTSGDVQEIAEGVPITSQFAAGTDWNYYRFTTPATLPDEIFINVTRNGGEVVLHLRDTVAPGLGTEGIFLARDESTAINHSDDNKNRGADYESSGWDEPTSWVLTSPTIRPATTYFIGARAEGDASYDIGLSYGPVTIDPLTEVDFDGGSFTAMLDPDEVRQIFIRVPVSGAFFEYTTEKGAGIITRVEQGAYPSLTGSVSYQDAGAANRGFKRSLTGTWPWIPDATYFVSFENTTAEPLALTFTMAEAVEDGDGLPDAWELANFGNLNQRDDDDANGDGIDNFMSYALSIDPLSGLADGGNPFPEYVIAPGASAGGVALSSLVARPDVTYIIERAEGLNGPWTAIATKEGAAAWDLPSVSSENGVTLVPDAEPASESAARFYRLKVVKITP
ncbi:hypothetical protein OAF27_02245 [Verrucomicrobiales bacterium]|nr:hypothetical protein [Verrucomicrobiales bacterium]